MKKILNLKNSKKVFQYGMALLLFCFIGLPQQAFAQPANDVCTGAIPITPSPPGTGCATAQFTLPFDTDGTTDSGLDGSCNNANTGLDQFFTWTATTTGLLWNDAAPGNPGIIVRANDGTPAAPICGAEIDCEGTFAGNDATLSGWNIGDDLIIQIYDFGTSISEVNFCLEEFTPPPPPPNDDCAGAIDLGGLASPITANTCSASNDFVGDCLTNAGSPDMFYSIVVPDGQVLVIGQTSNTYDSETRLAWGGACPGTNIISCNDDPDTGTFSWLNNTGSAQTAYWIQGAFSTGCGDFTLAWSLTFPPANDDCAGAIDVPVTIGTACGVQTAGTNFAASPSGETPAPSCSSFGGGQDVWHSVTVPASGEVTIEMSANGGPTDFAMSVYSGTCGALTEVECDDDDGPGLFPSITLTGQTPGDVLLVRVFEFGNNASGPYNICAWGPPPPGEDPCIAIPVTMNTIEPANGAFYSASPGEPSPGAGTTGPAPTCNAVDGWCSFETGVQNSMWFTFVGPPSGVVDIEILDNGNGGDTQLGVYTATDCADFTTFTEVGGNDDGGASLLSALFGLVVTPGVTYYVQVDGYDGNLYNVDLSISEPNVAPTITCGPNVSFTTSADGALGACLFSEFAGSYTIADDMAADLTVSELMTHPTEGVVKDATFTLAAGTYSPFGDFPAGVTTVEVTVTDGGGLSAMCSYTVTVTDDEAPMAVCNDVTLALDATGSATVTFDMIDGGSTDNCGIVAEAFNSPSVFDCSNLGANTVSYSVFDAEGLEGTCTATVTVVDELAPTVTCSDATFGTSADGQLGDCLYSGFAGTYVIDDNCGGALTVREFMFHPEEGIIKDATFGLSAGTWSPFAEFPVGETTVQIRVTDAAGNESMQCSYTVTITDDEPAVIVCGNDPISTKSVPGLCGHDDIKFNDPIVLEENCGIIGFSNNAPAFFPVGTTIVTFFAEDEGGNISTCEIPVTITDFEEPTIECVKLMQIWQTPNGQCQGAVNVPDAIVTDNCGVASYSNDAQNIYPVGTHYVTHTAEDIHGNVGTCITEVRVYDTQAPIIFNCPGVVNAELGSTIGDLNINLQATDNCGPWFVDAPDPTTVFSTTGSTTITYTVTDANGNATTCDVEVIVDDGGPSTVASGCPEDINVSLEEGQSSAYVSWNMPEFETNCECTPDNLPGFNYIGKYRGHKYYIYTDGKVTYEIANSIAGFYEGHLAVLGENEENDYVANFLGGDYGLWLGLMYNGNSQQYINDDGTPLGYTNWAPGFPSFPSDWSSAAIIDNFGQWQDVSMSDQYAFIMEVPCMDIEIAGIQNGGDNYGNFEEGTHTIECSITDMCGNFELCEFDINVMNSVVDPCQMGGNDATIFIENVTTDSDSHTSGDDEGYGNFLNETLTIPLGASNLSIEPNDNSVELFYRVWVDLNADGDWYDAAETLFEGSATGTANIPLDIPGQLLDQTVTMRIAVSKHGIPEPCVNFETGEVEDYLVQFKNDGFGGSNSQGFVINDDDTLVAISPNPASVIANLNIGEYSGKPGQISVMNSLGQLMSLADYSELPVGSVQIDVSAYATGIYWINVVVEEEPIATLKLLVE